MANLGNVGWHKLASVRFSGAGVTAVANGDISRSRSVLARAWAWPHYSQSNHLPGSGNAFTIPTARLVTLTLSGRFIEAAQGSVGAKFYDVQDGVFYAHEADGNGLWQVSIVGDIPTVTQVTHGYGIGQGQRPVTVTSGHLQVLAPGDFLLGVAMNFPYQLSGGSLQQMALSSANTLPLILTNGTNTTLQVTLNG